MSLTVCALIACALIVLIRQTRPDIALLLAAVCGVVMCAYAVTLALPVIEKIREYASLAGTDSELVGAIIKSVGVCFIAQTGADLCRDAGQTSLATRVESFGKLTVLGLSLPLFGRLLELTFGILKE